MRRDWRTAALCRTLGEPDLWFPDSLRDPHLDQIREAKTVCSHCPVKAQCLEWALANGVDDGIWGGLDRDEIRRIRRRQRRGKGRPEPLPCGTPAAYRRHMRHGERIDDACRNANRLEKAKQAERAAVAA